jgi:hypothetical protein
MKPSNTSIRLECAKSCSRGWKIRSCQVNFDYEASCREPFYYIKIRFLGAIL